MIFQWNIDCRASSIFLPYSFSFLSILEYIHWIFEPLPGNDIKTLRQNLQNVISRRPSMTEENRFRVTRIEPYFFHAKKNKKILFAFLFFFFSLFSFFYCFFFFLSLSLFSLFIRKPHEFTCKLRVGARRMYFEYPYQSGFCKFK